MTKFRLHDKFTVTGMQIGMILNTLWSVEELLEVMHDEVGPSNLDAFFDKDGNHIDISATCELIETILENNKMEVQYDQIR